MREDYVLVDLTPDMLPMKAVKAKNNNARLVQICAVNTADGYDLLYSFAEGYHFVNYKINVKRNDKIVSISDIYPSASLYENEMRELFGVNIEFIKLNYNDKLYTIDGVTPFRDDKKEGE